MDRLAVILARGGSKRLPFKNGLVFGDKPLIGWVIEAALGSGCFRRVLVSTDNTRLARIARNFGAWVPFIRPPNLASDTASSADALIHAVEWAIHAGEIPASAVIVLIQPTSPFLTSKHIQEAAEVFDRSGFVTLGSMRRIRERPEWMFRFSENGHAVPVDPGNLPRPAAELPPFLIENGAMFFVQAPHLLRTRSLYDLSRHGFYLMAESDSVDIDTPEDWAEAEARLAARTSRETAVKASVKGGGAEKSSNGTGSRRKASGRG